jgi:hypothetical protein
MSAYVGNPDEGGSQSCTLVAELGHFLLGRIDALVIFLTIFVKFQDLGFSFGT